MNFLHIIYDDKFFGFVSDIFAALPDVENRWLALARDPNEPLRHIDGLELWRLIGKKYFGSADMEDDLAWCDCLIVHYFFPDLAPMIMHAPAHVCIVWSGWGGDYYFLLPGGEQSLLGEETRCLLRALDTAQGVGLLRRAKRKIGGLKMFLCSHRAFLQAIKRIDFFSSPIPDDYQLLRSALAPNFRADYVQLNYGSVEQTFQPGTTDVIGQDILVGNSAYPTNNHAEVFSLLARMPLGDRRVIVPLSYGDERYRDAILALGNSLLGKHFKPILGFLPLEDYNALTGRCTVAIMNQRRQQALGNIGTMLHIGASVFFDERNAAYQFLVRKGAYVFSIRALADDGEVLFRGLTTEQKQRNRSVLQDFWGHDVVVKNAAHFVEVIRGRRNIGA
jgi:dTDP-N-acetylfucosamine:lipid II N-acetylfucosaminyltransferase